MKHSFSSSKCTLYPYKQKLGDSLLILLEQNIPLNYVLKLSMKVWANKVQVHQPVQVPTFNSILQKNTHCHKILLKNLLLNIHKQELQYLYELRWLLTSSASLAGAQLHQTSQIEGNYARWNQYNQILLAI